MNIHNFYIFNKIIFIFFYFLNKYLFILILIKKHVGHYFSFLYFRDWLVGGWWIITILFFCF